MPSVHAQNTFFHEKCYKKIVHLTMSKVHDTYSKVFLFLELFNSS